jgi:DNA-binding MarR family transcriptional regulator/N-acetylglutamate synthase-like GNAT family acetyltransferase
MEVGRLEARVEEFRRFNRFFTRRIGVLREGLLHSTYSLAEARVLFELAHQEGVTASDLSHELGLDPGYLSRILAGFEQGGLLDRVVSEADGRRRILRLTAEGEDTLSELDRRSREEISAMLEGIPEEDQRRLLDATRTVEQILGGDGSAPEPFLLRRHEPGDMGWVVQRHGALYAREYGWDGRFEALVARIVADFIEGYDPSWERCWIAETGGRNVGCVFVVRESEEVAKLRLLLVEPEARGVGLGTRLVAECVHFARERGYQKLVLWTNSVLGAARRIYEQHGFELVEEEEHHSFGADLVGQNWELELQ